MMLSSLDVFILAGAIGAPVFAEGGNMLFSEGALIASGGYLLAFPIASALVAEGLDRSRNAGLADFQGSTNLLVYRNDSSLSVWNLVACQCLLCDLLKRLSGALNHS